MNGVYESERTKKEITVGGYHTQDTDRLDALHENHLDVSMTVSTRAVRINPLITT